MAMIGQQFSRGDSLVQGKGQLHISCHVNVQKGIMGIGHNKQHSDVNQGMTSKNPIEVVVGSTKRAQAKCFKENFYPCPLVSLEHPWSNRLELQLDSLKSHLDSHQLLNREQAQNSTIIFPGYILYCFYEYSAMVMSIVLANS